ncbi:cytochrome c oxidase subunit 3 [Mucilaginibacter sp. RB4R14]|uniref:cytochrome c oxidase subunit 3 n=1 Tax=Mucilaginibacter aurantiaciroseus TaxID=2949308 RepID=UPI002090BEF2|nr:cytochrome c oxidase subunit 3 [Mucilaginibacter aurantiaciroseus]MCO5935693.1 cytochrome c oxidase subunit 3 [Mucilaginibacter aurantiaciroseus]
MMAQIQKEDRYNLAPKKFNMWIFIFTSFMFFAALTSGFIVYVGGSKAHGINIKLPDAFMYSTGVILLSSITMFLASNAAKALDRGKQQFYLMATIFLGVAFFIIQLSAWSYMIKNGVYFSNPNASQSFIYVFTGMHLLHIFAGLLLLANTLWRSTRSIEQVKNLYSVQMSSIFWHFVDIIWIYLYVFLLLNQ